MRNPTNVLGKDASGDSPGATSWRGTTANTPVLSLLSATTVTGLSKHISLFLCVFFHFKMVFEVATLAKKGGVLFFSLCTVWFRKAVQREARKKPKCVWYWPSLKSVLAGLLMCNTSKTQPAQSFNGIQRMLILLYTHTRACAAY